MNTINATKEQEMKLVWILIRSLHSDQITAVKAMQMISLIYGVVIDWHVFADVLDTMHHAEIITHKGFDVDGMSIYEL